MLASLHVLEPGDALTVLGEPAAFALALSNRLEPTRAALAALPNVISATCLTSAWLPNRAWALRALRRAQLELAIAGIIHLPGGGYMPGDTLWDYRQWGSGLARSDRWQTYSVRRVAGEREQQRRRAAARVAFHHALHREQNSWERDQILAEIFRRRCGLGLQDATGWIYPYMQELIL